MPNDIHHREFEEKDFTGAGIASKPFHRGSTGNPEFDARISELVRDWRCGRHNELVEELLVTALLLGHDEISVGDMKLINRTLKELRGANNSFGPYQHRRKVAVYGSARTAPDKPDFQAAEAFAEKMRDRGFMIITGAGDGIMGAANKGAGRRDSFGLNINLPFEQSANETINGDIKLVAFNYFFTRKLTFVKESDGIALFPGGFGTMDEGFELLTLIQTGKSIIIPIVMVESPGGKYWASWKTFLEEHLLAQGLISPEDFHLFKVTDDVDEAVEEIANFYKVFHSYRYVREKLSIRLKRSLAPAAMEQLQAEFGDLLKDGTFEQRRALRDELNEPALADMPRLVCVPHRRKFGRFRQLIDFINGAETV
jgi:uncharacterized protein (TIGR00730 family)